MPQRFSRLATTIGLGGLTWLAAAVAAQAAPIRINTGTDFNLDPNGSTRTAAFESFRQTGTLDTRIYLGDPLMVGTTVVNTNIPSIMVFYGFSTGTKTALDGSSTSLAFPNAPSQNNIDELRNAASPDLNGFTGGVAFPQYGAGNVGGIGGAWGLTFSYQYVGTTVDTDGDARADRIDYTAGILSMYYQSAVNNPNNGKEVLRLILEGSTAAGVSGTVDYAYAVGDSFVQSFLEDGRTGSTLYSRWLSDPTSIRWTMNLPSGLDAPSALWNAGSSLIAQLPFDADLQLETVPEPGSLMLGLLALGGVVATRRRAARHTGQPG